ncbi:helix-turn-helix domain-containing protein [Actinocorallia lasiicapitis]
MAARLNDLVRATVDECAREVPFYRQLPEEFLKATVTDNFKVALQLWADAFAEDRDPNAAEMTEVIDRSAQRAAEGVPLDAVLSAYLLSAQVCWDMLCADADPDEMRRYTRHTYRYYAKIIPATALAHLLEQRQIDGQRQETRRDLIQALLTGEPAAALAEQFGIALSPSYLVVLLRMEPGPPDAIRTARRVQAALDAALQADVLASCTIDEAIVLLPDTPAATEALPRLISVLAETAEREVTASVAEAPRLAAIPDALEEANQVADLVARLRLPHALYRLEDVLIEYQLARPGRARTALAATLDPIDGQPVLLETAQSFVRHGHNRAQTAADLNIHRNTLDYRLTKLGKLTGLDLASPRGLRHLDAAVSVRSLA